MLSIPCALSKGEVISPFFIFDGKYRKYMGEFFTLIGLQYLSLIPAFLFLVVPGIIISIGWSLSLYILVDKGVDASEAMVQSNKATYGYKETIFLVNLLLCVAFFIGIQLLSLIFGWISEGLVALFVLAFAICFVAINFGIEGYIYRQLKPEEVSLEEA